MVRYAFLIAVLSIVTSRSLAAETADELTYERDVRPILKAHCFHCHGERGERKGGLDLRLRRLMVEGGESGPAIVPAQSDSSYLLERLRSGEMPPGDERLPDADIDLIERWIAAGAPTAYDEPEQVGDGPIFTHEERNFWSFRPIERPPLPQVSDAARVHTAVDRFLLARLEQEGLGYSPEADRRTLIRRVYFDLLGLPPTPEEVEQFVADESPDAYERLVDRLLDSPHYGERWARHWLDVAGYADSEGYAEADNERPWAYRYRDYVIRSFNDDKPLDQFIHEQLAGDELVQPPYRDLATQDIERLTATGFLRMAPDGTGSGGVDQRVARNETIAGTLKIVSSSLLGLTLDCARCHDHRYDPITQADYYRLRAIFEPALDGSAWKNPAQRRISLYTEADRRLAAEIDAEAAEVDKQREELAQQYIQRTLEEELATLADELREPLRAAYNTPAGERTDEQKALLKEHPSVAAISVGSLYLYDRRRDARARKLDVEAQEREKQLVEEVRQKALAAVPAEQRDAVQAAQQAAVERRTSEQSELLEQFPAVLVTAATLKEFAPEAAAEVQQLRDEARELRESKAADNLKKLADQAAEIRSRIPKEHFIRALTEEPGKVPETRLFIRGDHEQPGEVLEPAGLAVLSDRLPARISQDDAALPTTGRRLAFARWLTDPRHPLTARVLANRLWLNHFGRGLVDTPGDLGMLGDRPSHPELLDYLASELIESGWSQKHMHRLIVTSAAYRQQSRPRDELTAKDPDNRLYGRMNRRRLEAEAVRDAVLQISGRLTRKLYGEPVPVMEDEVGQIVVGKENLDGERKPGAEVPLGEEEFRRSIYVQVRRSRPLGVMETFDQPAMDPNCERRSPSNVAPQALLLMNSEFVLRYAEAFAARVAQEAGDDRAARVQLAWQLAFGRPPQDDELALAIDFLERQTASFAAAEEKPEGSTDQQLALASLCQTLLSANPFLYVD